MPGGARFELKCGGFRVGAVSAAGEARQQDPIVKARPTVVFEASTRCSILNGTPPNAGPKIAVKAHAE
jgi:hypothetical protein